MGRKKFKNKNQFLRLQITLFLVGLSAWAYSQDTIRLMHYNLMYYGKNVYDCNSSTNNIDTKNQSLKTIIKYAKPDIFSVNELDGQGDYPQADDASYLLNNALNVDGVSYYRKTETPTIYLANIIFYNANKLILKKSQPISFTYGGLQKIFNVYQFYFNSADLSTSNDTAFIYFAVAHLKAGSDDLNQTQRAYETSLLMNYFENLGEAGNYIVMGDFNVYSPTEECFQNLINPDNNLYAFNDPANQIGEWSGNYDYRFVHTQSTHSYGDCFSTGGMDDRFDFILASDYIMSGYDHYEYIEGTYKALGQDGSNFNGALRISGNSAVPSTVAQALYNMSDHLPVYMELKVDQDLGEPLSVEEIEHSPHINISNPVSDELNIYINLKQKTDLRIEIISLSGEKVFTEYYQQISGMFNPTISVSSLNQGLYIVNILDELKSIYTGKIVISR